MEIIVKQRVSTRGDSASQRTVGSIWRDIFSCHSQAGVGVATGSSVKSTKTVLNILQWTSQLP